MSEIRMKIKVKNCIEKEAINYWIQSNLKKYLFEYVNYNTKYLNNNASCY
jgi:hypothetical protein